MAKIKVISCVTGAVGVTVPELHFKRTWMAKGATIEIEKEVLTELMYDIGFANMIRQSILYIDDLQFLKENGLEPEDATENVNLLHLTEAEIKMYWQNLNLAKFKEKCSKLSHDQLNELSQWAINNNVVDYDKCDVIRQLTGQDIINTIRLKKADQEPIKDEQ